MKKSPTPRHFLKEGRSLSGHHLKTMTSGHHLKTMPSSQYLKKMLSSQHLETMLSKLAMPMRKALIMTQIA